MHSKSQCQFGTFLYVILDVTTSGHASHLMCHWDMSCAHQNIAQMSGACELVVSHDMHWNTHMLILMPPLNPCQRWVLVCSLIPLIDLIGAPANAAMSVGFSKSSPPITLMLTPALATIAAMADDNETPPRPEQGGVRIMEAYLLGISEAECIWRFRYVSQATAFTQSCLTFVYFTDLPQENSSC